MHMFNHSGSHMGDHIFWIHCRQMLYTYCAHICRADLALLSNTTKPVESKDDPNWIIILVIMKITIMDLWTANPCVGKQYISLSFSVPFLKRHVKNPDVTVAVTPGWLMTSNLYPARTRSCSTSKLSLLQLASFALMNSIVGQKREGKAPQLPQTRAFESILITPITPPSPSLIHERIFSDLSWKSKQPRFAVAQSRPQRGNFPLWMSVGKGVFK